MVNARYRPTPVAYDLVRKESWKVDAVRIQRQSRFISPAEAHCMARLRPSGRMSLEPADLSVFPRINNESNLLIIGFQALCGLGLLATGQHCSRQIALAVAAREDYNRYLMMNKEKITHQITRPPFEPSTSFGLDRERRSAHSLRRVQSTPT